MLHAGRNFQRKHNKHKTGHPPAKSGIKTIRIDGISGFVHRNGIFRTLQEGSFFTNKNDWIILTIQSLLLICAICYLFQIAVFVHAERWGFHRSMVFKNGHLSSPFHNLNKSLVIFSHCR